MALRIIEQQPHVIEEDHAMQPLGEIAKQLGEVAVDGDCLRNLQQSLVLLCQSLTGRYRMPIHRCAKYARLLWGAQGAEREFLPLRRASRIRNSPFMRSAGRCTRSPWPGRTHSKGYSSSLFAELRKADSFQT